MACCLHRYIMSHFTYIIKKRREKGALTSYKNNKIRIVIPVLDVQALLKYGIIERTITNTAWNLNLRLREEDSKMSNNWITDAEAAAIISKNSHHPVSSNHIQTLVNRGKIGMRSFDGGTKLLKRSDVESTRVAVGTGNSHRRDRVETPWVVTARWGNGRISGDNWKGRHLFMKRSSMKQERCSPISSRLATGYWHYFPAFS